MTIGEAYRILDACDAIRHGCVLDVPPDEPQVDGWLFWAPGSSETHARLGGYWYTADELEAIVVWMRTYGQQEPVGGLS